MRKLSMYWLFRDILRKVVIFVACARCSDMAENSLLLASMLMWWTISLQLLEQGGSVLELIHRLDPVGSSIIPRWTCAQVHARKRDRSRLIRSKGTVVSFKCLTQPIIHIWLLWYVHSPGHGKMESVPCQRSVRLYDKVTYDKIELSVGDFWHCRRSRAPKQVALPTRQTSRCSFSMWGFASQPLTI